MRHRTESMVHLPDCCRVDMCALCVWTARGTRGRRCKRAVHGRYTQPQAYVPGLLLGFGGENAT